MFRLSALLLLGLCSSLPSLAGNGTSADPSKFPKREDIFADFSTGFKKPVEAFFDERDSDPKLKECRAALDDVKKEYKAARAEKDYATMELLLVGDSDSDKERDKGLAKLLDTCGRCSTKVTPLDKNTQNPIYESDGWCRLPGRDAAERKRSFEIAVKRLTNPKTYAKSNGGLNYLMKFDAIDGAGNPTENAASPFLAQIVVKGIMGIAFGYNVVNHYETRKTGDVDEFVLQFGKVKDPAFALKKVRDEDERKDYSVFSLPEVYGQWFVDTEGNFRYFNRAKFTLPPVIGNIFNLEALAHRIHMDTLFHIYDDLMEGAGE